MLVVKRQTYTALVALGTSDLKRIRWTSLPRFFTARSIRLFVSSCHMAKGYPASPVRAKASPWSMVMAQHGLTEEIMSLASFTGLISSSPRIDLAPLGLGIWKVSRSGRSRRGDGRRKGAKPFHGCYVISFRHKLEMIGFASSVCRSGQAAPSRRMGIWTT